VLGKFQIFTFGCGGFEPISPNDPQSMVSGGVAVVTMCADASVECVVGVAVDEAVDDGDVLSL